MPRAFGILIVLFFAAASFRLAVQKTFVNPYARLCDMVSSRIYLDDAQLEDWKKLCASRAALVQPFTPADVIAEDARNVFSTLRVSHLDLFNANESRRIWSGKIEETGIESEFVDGEMVIFSVNPDSPAADAGLKRGDIIVTIQGAHPAPALARSVGGTYRIRRLDKELDVEIDPREITLDESPRVTRQGDWTIVKVPSFRAEFFESGRWKDVVREIGPSRLILVDLRGNPGGNFVAGLRFLSPFMCAEQDIGYLLKPKSPGGRQIPFADDLRDLSQLDVIDRADIVRLRTFPDYGCLTSRVEVLIDSASASTSEMVAQALRDYLGAKVHGTSSAGQLLVGVWYDVPELGDGWRVSIPEAVFQTRRGRRLEGAGVRVDRELYYDLKDLQAGRDTWIDKVVDEPVRKRATASSVSK